MTIIIRTIKEDDLAELIILLHPHQEDLSKEHIKALLAKLILSPHCSLFVVLHDSLMVAAFSLLIMDNLAHEGARSGVMDDVVISSVVPQEPIAIEIMNFALQQCDQLKCYKLCVSTHPFVPLLLEADSTFMQHGRCFVRDNNFLGLNKSKIFLGFYFNMRFSWALSWLGKYN